MTKESKPIANGTLAKEIGIYFINKTTGKATPNIMQRTITIAKSMLTSGYTVEEITSAIDYLVDVKKVDMYSLGYLSSSINNVLAEINKFYALKEVQDAKREILPTSEVIKDESASERNRAKLGRFGAKSRIREEYNFDLPTE